MKILGLDVGEKRIGIARVDSDTRIAVPVGYIDVDGLEWQEIEHVAKINGTNIFVLGLPRSNEGNETAQSLYVRNFAKTLTEKIPGARIRFQDESFTSVVAEERLKQRKKKYEKGEIDAEAATIILQDFVENLANLTPVAQENVEVEEQNNSHIPEMVTDIRAAVIEAGEAMTNITKKEADKMKLQTKKAKHKMKKATGWITVIAILVILGLIATGVALFIREKRHQEYLAWVAEQEAQMVAEVFNFTIRPGETIFDIKQNLIKEGYSAEEIEEAFKANYDFPFLQERPEGASLEGYLYGETHEFYKSASVKEILETFLTGMGEVITENNLEEKYKEQGLSLYEGITLASVVQKEASPSEQATVAQVFLSRLAYGIPLGSDVTVSYALDVVDPNRETYQDNQAALKVDSCYNTRVYAGLPCGPISNPALSALLAVAEPTDTAYLYFLTGDDGLMYYSYTEAEHNQNIYSHCQNLCNVSL
ncbi:endolytic transglycosylase MltG [Candidatus Saccharibacteria bacterium]|nr:endolytic transglycosylase MltG [Candidatus Saccharibacteria bacterium]